MLLALFVGPGSVDGIKFLTGTGDIAVIDQLKDINSQINELNSRVMALEYQVRFMSQSNEGFKAFRDLP